MQFCTVDCSCGSPATGVITWHAHYDDKDAYDELNRTHIHSCMISCNPVYHKTAPFTLSRICASLEASLRPLTPLRLRTGGLVSFWGGSYPAWPLGRAGCERRLRRVQREDKSLRSRSAGLLRTGWGQGVRSPGQVVRDSFTISRTFMQDSASSQAWIRICIIFEFVVAESTRPCMQKPGITIRKTDKQVVVYAGGKAASHHICDIMMRVLRTCYDMARCYSIKSRVQSVVLQHKVPCSKCRSTADMS